MANRLCEDGTVCYFDSDRWSCLPGGKGFLVMRYGKFDSILTNCLKTSFRGGGTDLGLPMLYALEEDKSAAIHPFDRILYFSDNECNSGISRAGGTVQNYVDRYRKQYNPKFWVHGVDLQGYGSQQFCGEGFNLIAGWSESVLPFILLAERGIGSLVDTIAAYDIDS